MFSRQRYRCWAGIDPRMETQWDVPHFQSEESAWRWIWKDLVDDLELCSFGKIQQEDMRIRDVFQKTHTCWIMKCNGCRKQLVGPDGQRHWPTQWHITNAADEAGWERWVHMCADCRELVIPIHRNEERNARRQRQSFAPSAS